MDSKKTIVVSGCTRGIGRAVCDLFAKKGFNIAGYARNKTAIEEQLNAYKTSYPQQQFFFQTVDATKKSEVIAFGNNVKKEFGSIAILVNNAGYFLPGSIMNEADGILESLIETNVYSAYYLTKTLNKSIKRNIFNMCSIASLQAYEGGASYTISKFAMLGFSKQLRHELKGSGIKVTAILPGAVRTDSWNGTSLPEARFIKPLDIAETIFNIYGLSDSTDIEEVLIRPEQGDI